MQRYILIGLSVVAATFGAGVAAGWFRRPEPPPAGPPPAAEITYVCRETRALVRGPRQPTPAVNPKTGRATLVQALYCRKCRTWYPAPPEAVARDQMPGGPICPKTGAPLEETGPAHSRS